MKYARINLIMQQTGCMNLKPFEYMAINRNHRMVKLHAKCLTGADWKHPLKVVFAYTDCPVQRVQ